MLGPCAPPAASTASWRAKAIEPREKLIVTGLGPALQASHAARFPNPDSVGL